MYVSNCLPHKSPNTERNIFHQEKDPVSSQDTFKLKNFGLGGQLRKLSGPIWPNLEDDKCFLVWRWIVYFCRYWSRVLKRKLSRTWNMIANHEVPKGFFFWNNSEIPHNSKSKIWEKLDKSSKDDMARILTSVNSYSLKLIELIRNIDLREQLRNHRKVFSLPEATTALSSMTVVHVLVRDTNCCGDQGSCELVCRVIP